MKNRIIGLILALSLICSFPAVSILAEDDYAVDCGLLTALSGELGITLPQSDGEVSRGDFLLAVTQLISLNGDAADEKVYADIPAKSALGYAAYHASILGIVSPAENFNPDQSITVNEAIKIMCSALGYSELANARGGYPYGYIAIANELELLEDTGLSGESFIKKESFYALMYNFACAPVYEIFNVSYDGISYATKRISGGTLPEVYHDIFSIEGIVKSDNASDLYDESIDVAGTVCIGELTLNGKCTGLLGMNVRAFYRRESAGKNTLIAIEPYQNSVTIVYSSDNPVFSESSVAYEKDGKDKTLKFDEELAVIYNGKADKKLAPADISFVDGCAELIDNNSDSRIDCVRIRDVKYLVTDKTDIADKIIYDVNFSGVIDMSESDVLYEFTGIDGIEDILVGSCIEYTVSKDGKLYSLKIADRVVSGKLEGYDHESRSLYIDGASYGYSAYYEANYLASTPSGSEVSVTVSDEGKIIAVNSSESKSFEYAYLFGVASKTGGIDTGSRIKVFSQIGKLEILTLDDTVVLNGAKVLSDSLASSLNGEQLIRFRRNREGIVTAINTCHSEHGIFDSSVEDGNILKRYWYAGEDSTKNVYYTKNGFVPTYFMVNSSSKLFRVLPEDVESDDAKRVQLVAVNKLVTSNPSVASTKLEAYNVSKSGYAAAVVYRVDKDASMYTRASWGIVSSASYALDEDGEKVIKLEMYNDGKFGFMYIRADNPYLGANAESVIPFAQGDCIRYESADGVTIEKFKKDFDASSKTLSYSTSNDYSALNYYYGRLEAVYSNSITFTLKDSGGNERLAFYPSSVSQYCFVDKTGNVQTLPYSKLAGLLQSGREYNVLLRCSDTILDQIIVYEIH